MEERAQLSDLRSLYIFSRQDTPPVPLDQVATVSLEPVTPKTKRFDQSIQNISAIGWKWTDTNGWVSARQLHPAPPLRHFYDYVLASDFLVPIQIRAALNE